MTAPQFRDQTVRFGTDGALNGILTLPGDAAHAPRLGMVMINSGIVHRVGVSRLHVETARALAADGVASLRFDLSGIGDSGVADDAGVLQEMVDRDVEAALELLRSRWAEIPLIGLGLCSGAHDLVRAISRESGLAGVVLLDLFADYRTKKFVLKHYTGRLGSPQSWWNALLDPLGRVGTLAARWRGMSEESAASVALLGSRPRLSRAQLDATLERIESHKLEALLIFTAGLETNYNYRDQLADAYPERVGATPRIAWEYFRDASHIFDAEASREVLVQRIRAWLDERFPR